MNVSESIDWRHSTPGELDLHRFIGLTRRGQTLDGYLFRSINVSRKYDHEKNYISPPQNYINHHRFL